MCLKKDDIILGMVSELRGGVWVNDTPIEERIAGLHDLHKLPIGPTLPLIQFVEKNSQVDLEKSDEEVRNP